MRGNSLALLINKPICELLGFSIETPLRLSVDGRRLVVEASEAEPSTISPARSSPVPAVSIAPAVPVVPAVPSPPKEPTQSAIYNAFMALFDDFCMSQERFVALHGEGRVLAFRGWIQFAFPREFTPQRRAMIRRHAICLRQLRMGVGWEEAIRATRAEVDGERPDSSGTNSSAPDVRDAQVCREAGESEAADSESPDARVELPVGAEAAAAAIFEVLQITV